MRTQTEINTGISKSSRQKAAQLLNALLADEYVLYTKTRNYHWNVAGPHFHELHKFFEAQYQQLDQSIDDIAERARALGADAVGTLTEFLRLTSLHEHPAECSDAHRMLTDLCADHETVIRSLRAGVDACAEQYRDAGTADFLTGLMEQHEKMAWMLRAQLK